MRELGDAEKSRREKRRLVRSRPLLPLSLSNHLPKETSLEDDEEVFADKRCGSEVLQVSSADDVI